MNDEFMEIYTRIANLHRELAEAYDELASSFYPEDEDEDEEISLSSLSGKLTAKSEEIV